MLKDTANIVSLWDLTTASKIEDYGIVSFEDKIHQLFEMIYVPQWFTLDINGTVKYIINLFLNIFLLVFKCKFGFS